MKLRSVLMLAVAGALSPMAAQAADLPWQVAEDYAAKINGANILTTPEMTIDPAKAFAAEERADRTGQAPVLSLDAVAPGSKIHGFADFKINTQYITPRGLVAEEDSPQFQTLFGLVFNVYSGDGFINGVSLIGGIWSDLNPHPDKSVVTGADIVTEVDIFGGFDVKFAKKWDLAYTIQAWTFPDLTNGTTREIDPSTEYNMDLKLSFDDSEYLKDFALHPYVDIFWNFAGASSPVVSQAGGGKNDHTFYAELGIAPSYTFKGIADLPITFTLPAYWTFGDSSFWGSGVSGKASNLGVASVGLKISAPLTFIPKDFGNWSTYIGVTYIHTCNPNLTAINSGTGADSNLVLGYAGVGFGF